MVTLPTRELKIGQIIDKTLAVLEINAVPALIFVAVLTAFSLPIAYATAGSTAPMQAMGGQLLQSAIGIVCGYFLLVIMVRRTGLQARTDDDVFLPYLGLSIVSTLAVMVGMIALIIPGLILMIRWSVAQPLIVARGGGVLATLGESWERTRGSEFSIFVATLAVLLPLIAVLIAAGAFFEEGNLVGMVVSQLATSGISLVYPATGVAICGLIMSREAAAVAPST